MSEPLRLSAFFNRPPAEAVDFLRQKDLLPSVEWHTVLDDAHNHAFVVAHLTRLDVLEEIRTSLVEALAKGATFDQWFKGLKPVLQAKGWWGKDFVNAAGAARAVETGSPRRLETIYRTNLQSAYMAGRRAQMLEAVDTHPYWRYVAVMDARTRPSHRALHGRVMAAGDGAWDTVFPPCGFNCRCRAVPMTAGAVERGGYVVESSAGHLTTEVVPVGDGRQVAKVTRLQLPSMPTPFQTDAGFNSAPGRLSAVVGRLAEKTDVAKLTPMKVPKGLNAEWPTFSPADMGPDEWAKLGIPRLEELLAHTIEGKTVAQWLGLETSDYAKKHRLVAEYLQEQLRVRRHAGRTKSNVKGAGKGAKAIKQASSRYPEGWVQSANALGELQAIYSADRGWAYTATKDGRVRFVGTKVYQAKKGDGWIMTDDSSTAEHEFGHRVQAARPDLDKVFQDEHRARTKAESLQPLRNLTGLDYQLDEVAKPDGYYNPYQGREYVDDGGALEVMTMALQPLLGQDSKAAMMMHQMFNQDRRMIELALGLLFHAR